MDLGNGQETRYVHINKCWYVVLSVFCTSAKTSFIRIIIMFCNVHHFCGEMKFVSFFVGFYFVLYMCSSRKVVYISTSQRLCKDNEV